jgi:ATP-dependent DNA helicase RecG
MPTALEKLIKILKLEKQQGFHNTAVIGGLEAYAENWANEARQEAQRPEQYALVDEILLVMADYQRAQNHQDRQQLAVYMFERMTRRAEQNPKYAVAIPSEMPARPASNEKKRPPQERSERQERPERKKDKSRRPDDLMEESRQSQSRRPPRPPAPPSQERWPKPRRKRAAQFDLARAKSLMDELQAPLTTQRGIGPGMATKLENLGLETVGDMLYHFPRRYDDYTRMLPINRLQPNETYTIIATIRSIHQRAGKSGIQILALTVDDGTGKMDISFFNQPWLRSQLREGMQLVFSGKTDLFLGRVTMSNPAWEPVEQESLHTGGIVPIYPLTKGLSAHTMRKLMRRLLDEWEQKIPDIAPSSVLDRANQVDLSWAVRQIHFPERWEYLEYARERLAFDQLLQLQLGVLANRLEWQAQPAQPLPVDDAWLEAMIAALPFELTGAQHRVIQEVRHDLAHTLPMNRMLQGDVGSGKTTIALAQLAIAAINGKQAVLMAPTSILAEQHYRKLSQQMRSLPQLEHKRVELLSGGLSASARRKIYDGIQDGSIDIVIGTHAVIQEGVEFKDLGAVVIDEQHRFGVEQRGMLRGKGTNPHVLVMTATPIPRTLSLTMYADLDLSLLDEMPPGRTPIQTRIVDHDQRQRVYEFVEDRVLKEGRQAYIIFPLIDPNDKIEAQAATDGYDYIRKYVFPQYSIGLIHGRMRAVEKEAAMLDFVTGRTHILVSTSVIEVGVDVPNATAIVIENAERFGLAQLHQLRGRVGRGEHKSYCLLLSHAEESPRLQALEESTDGFYLAQKDWEQRGAGDLLGVRQSGGPSRGSLAEFMTIGLVELAQQESRAIYAEDPHLELPEHQLIGRLARAHRDERTDSS